MCLREPEVPANVTVPLLDVVVALAESVSCAGTEGVRIIVEGETEMPAGSPLT